MRHAKKEQPAHPPEVDRGGSFAAGFDPLGEKADPGSEQHREQGDELQLGEHVGQEPDHPVQAGEIPPGGGVQIGDCRGGEKPDVDEQDAEDGDPAKHVETPQPFSGRNRTGGRVHGLAAFARGWVFR